MVIRLQVFASYRMGGLGGSCPGERATNTGDRGCTNGDGGGDRGSLPHARELVLAALGDTMEGVVRWYPERKSLEQHLQDVIKRRSSLDWKRAQRFRHESIDATTQDGYSPTLAELENTLVERLPDPHAVENAQAAVEEVKQLVASEPDVAAYVEARENNKKGRALMRATGLTPQQYRRCRRLLAPILQGLSVRARPRRRNQGTKS
jgi:hypothetical protein